MKKWKLLLSAFGVLTPLAISTPFIVGCSKSEKQQEVKQYRFLVHKNVSTSYVQKQVLEGYDNYFQPVWKNVDNGTTIRYVDWEQFEKQANEMNIPIVYE